ncbi:isoamyl acetate-hydrolyzing esterase 1 [Biomphalaria pfeifferi]|uniref:Isoamyl acetate-hydrolyzing esterase 1 homolog n=1 Tax=Biomphalaria pfeifferi TaxID=112525 RepID=A0AAD8BRK4_BIOPF|nr:isoamyl acetate-hydrolyzing esterase 1 [Biomphalaria pfeifferi]
MASKKIISWPKIFLFGDSITQYCFSKDGCWGTMLADYYQRRCDLMVRGFSGYNTRWCNIILPSILDADIAKDTVAFTVFLGANDSNDASLNPRQHVPLAEFEQNLKNIVTFAMSQGISREKIILISPPAFNAEAWSKVCLERGKPLSKDNDTTGVYAQACCKVADEMGTKKVDLYSAMMRSMDFTLYLNDGLHLSGKGSELLFDLLQPLLKQLTSDVPQVWFPAYDQVDLENVDQSLLDV